MGIYNLIAHRHTVAFLGTNAIFSKSTIYMCRERTVPRGDELDHRNKH